MLFRSQRAITYARSSASARCVQMEVDPATLRLASKIQVNVETVITELQNLHRIRNLARLCKDLRESAAATNGIIRVSWLTNLASEYGMHSGESGVQLNEVVRRLGANAEVIGQGGEDWLVAYDPAILVRVRVRSLSDIPAADYNRGRVADQLAALSAAPTEKPTASTLSAPKSRPRRRRQPG